MANAWQAHADDTLSQAVSGWMYRGNPAHTGVYDDGGNPPGNISAWNFYLGKAGMFYPTSSPIVVDGTVFVGSTNGMVYAINASTGTPAWEYMTGYSITSSPAIANGIVYIGNQHISEDLSPDNTKGENHADIYAFNANNGTLVWYCDTGGGVGASPVIANGTVFFGTFIRGLYALNASTGAVLWNTTNVTARGYFGCSSPAVVDGVVYVGGEGPNLTVYHVFAMNALNGTLLWKYPVNGSIHSSPAVANGIVYIGCDDGNVYALDADTGTLVWKYPVGGDYVTSPAVSDTGIVIVAGSNGVYALKADTGALVWKYTAIYEFYSSPSIAGGKIYIGNRDFNVYALDLRTGALLWKCATGGVVDTSPAIDRDGMIYVVDGSDHLCAIGKAMQTTGPAKTPASIAPIVILIIAAVAYYRIRRDP